MNNMILTRLAAALQGQEGSPLGINDVQLIVKKVSDSFFRNLASSYYSC
jgi:hypothetical protein